MVTADYHMVCETCAEGCLLQSHGLCGITPSINIPVLC